MFRFSKTISAILACCIIFTFMHFDALATTSSGWQQNDNNEWYYVGSDGELLTGWQEISGKKYFFNDDGIMLTGWQNIDSKWYYFNSSGTMQTGWQKLSGKWYYFDADGAMLKGWQKISNKWYYFDASGVMKTGWQKISGKYYYFNSSGTMLTGWQQISGKWYFLNSSGAMQTGWLNRSGKWYYLNASGAMQTGSQQISGKWYLFDDNGIMQTSFQEVDGKIYYYEASGAMKTGLVWINGDLYYFNSSMQKGWKSVDGKYYYFTDDGIAVVGDFFEQSGKTYYFNDQGVMQTGLVVIGDDTYYFRDSGAMVVDDTVDGMRFGPDGKMITGSSILDLIESTSWWLSDDGLYTNAEYIELDLWFTEKPDSSVYYEVYYQDELLYVSDIQSIEHSYFEAIYGEDQGASIIGGKILDGFYNIKIYEAVTNVLLASEYTFVKITDDGPYTIYNDDFADIKNIGWWDYEIEEADGSVHGTMASDAVYCIDTRTIAFSIELYSTGRQIYFAYYYVPDEDADFDDVNLGNPTYARTLNCTAYDDGTIFYDIDYTPNTMQAGTYFLVIAANRSSLNNPYVTATCHVIPQYSSEFMD